MKRIKTINYMSLNLIKIYFNKYIVKNDTKYIVKNDNNIDYMKIKNNIKFVVT